MRWLRAKDSDFTLHKVGDFTRDATALLLSWILAERAISAITAAGDTPVGHLKAWNDEMTTEGFNFSDWDIGSTLCEKYVEPKAWAPVCDELYKVLDHKEVDQASPYKVDDALVQFLVRIIYY